MDGATYAAEAALEATHWWFVGRRRLFARLIRRLAIPRDAEVLDIGTSTGTNLRLLASLGFENYRGIDNSEEAIRWCADKGLGRVTHGDVTALPFRDDEFSLVLATDIIEHVDDDLAALREIRRVLAPGRYALITVPAFQSLWGLQDCVSHHRRRYVKSQLLARVQESGLRCVSAFYFNFLLFLPTWLVRVLMRRLRINLDSENQLNSPLINRFLTAVFALDVLSAEAIQPPVGVSILALVEKPPGDAGDESLRQG